MCEMMSASRKRGLFLEVKPVNVTGLRSPGHSVQKMQNNRDFEDIANKKKAFPEFGKAFFAGGDSRSRTDDPLLAKQVL